MNSIILSAEEVQAIYNKLDSIEKSIKTCHKHDDDPILTTEQVVDLLNISRRKLQNMRYNLEIEYIQLNGKFLYRMSSIMKCLDQHVIKANN